jgi:hypothetical protein
MAGQVHTNQQRGSTVTASDQESSSDIMLRLVGLYREVAQAAAVTYQHVKQAADLFEIDPVHPEGFAALSKARAAEQRMQELDERAASLEATYRRDPARRSNGSLTEWPQNGSSTNSWNGWKRTSANYFPRK